jgi:uncharacterized protein (TIGR02466 family)
MIKNLFNVPIYHGKLIDNKRHVAHLKEVAEDIRKETDDMTGLPWNCHVWSTYAYDNQLFKRKEFHSVALDISSQVREYATARGWKHDPKELIMSNLFLNYQTKYQYQEYHDHRECLISGVFYIDVPDEDNMEIMFYTPLKANYDDLFFHSDDVQEVIKIKPQTGDILIFPSWLNHGVMSHTTDTKRINIAFNFSTKQMRSVFDYENVMYEKDH